MTRDAKRAETFLRPGKLTRLSAAPATPDEPVRFGEGEPYTLGVDVATPVSALHVHVGMPDAETAIRSLNGLRRHLPLLEAVAANSPFRHGRDTGLASARALTLRGWPRSGAPREMRDFDDFWR